MPDPARVLATLLIGGLLGGCGPRESPLVLLAAASLREPLRALAERGQPRFVPSFAGSHVLAAQLRAGARADVVATANREIMRSLEREGIVTHVRTFATNRIVAAYRRDLEPLGGIADVAARRLRVVIGSPEVPAGAYARAALSGLGHWSAIEPLVVSNEIDVRGVVTKLLISGAEVGFVYATDAAREPARLAWLELPELPAGSAPPVRYFAAALSESARIQPARRLVDSLLEADAQRLLSRAGFGPP